MPPYEVLIHPCSYCNLSCKWCIGSYVANNKEKLLKTSLNKIENMEKVIDGILSYKKVGKDYINGGVKTFKVENVSFSGITGEPMIAKESVLYAINKLKENNIRVGMFTNGVLLTLDIHETLLKMDYILISLDAGENSTYVKLKCNDTDNNEFYTIINNIKALSIKKKEINSDTDINIGYMLNQFNYNEIYKIAKAMEQIGIHYFRLKTDISSQMLLNETQNAIVKEQINKIKDELQDDNFKFVEIHRLGNEKEKISNIGIIGLGYVGLPLFLEFSKKINVIGYDKSITKIKQLKEKYPAQKFVTCIEDLENCSCYIVEVPTPINDDLLPDLSCVIEATESVSLILKKGDIVIYESTVFPGTTENICKKIIEERTKMVYNKDFYFGYSPERINPGDTIHNLSNTIKIVSGSNDTSVKEVENIYKLIIDKTYAVINIKTAEAIKLLENTQRDVNIALMNEFKHICAKENIDIHEVIDGASTKWNFYKCYPGLVGGHCISVDPYYYIYYAKKLGKKCDLVENARKINENVKRDVVNQINKSVEEIYNRKKRVLVIGLTYKPNVDDTRNSKIVEIIKSLDKSKYDIFAVDDLVNVEEMQKNDIQLINMQQANDLDLIIFATLHDKYKELPYEYFKNMFKDKVRVIEIGNFYKKYFEKDSDFYWNL